MFAALRTGRIGRLLVAVPFAVGFLALGNVPGAGPVSTVSIGTARADSGCQLNSAGGAIKHVIYIQFDNVHYRRDNPNVPSDIQQMPNLLNFLKDNGTFLTDEHTPLIAHTADDIITSLTGVYGDRHGQPVANSFDYFKSDGTPQYGNSSFTYWTDRVDPPNDPTYNLITADGKNAPAPWVPYTRAGCNVGAFSTADIELENTSSDLATVFGPSSSEYQEGQTNPDKAAADFDGISIHCAAGNSVCSSANGGVPDVLPEEPGGYHGFNALFGAKFINPYLTSGGTVVDDLNGQPIEDSHGNPGFPGFDPTAAQSLAYTADMQEQGVPVTFTYIADTHDSESGSGAFGPGEAGFVAQNAAYNEAFGKFFANLRAHGINKNNTLFVVTADEGDHFVGGPPSPANCDGVTVPCTYQKKGEIDANMTGLLQSEFGITTPFDIHFDSAPVVYINGQPSQTDESITRPFERATWRLTATSPITGKRDRLTRFMADQPELRLMHMLTADSQRNPTFVDFGNPNYYFQTYDPCSGQLVCEDSEFAWNHGDVGTHINTTFLGFVGPGVKHLGITGKLWTDHTDIRPTILSLVGLSDDYIPDGRVITQILAPQALNSVEATDATWLERLGAVYKQINAPVGQLALNTLVASSHAMRSGTASNDEEYMRFRGEINRLTDQRNALASQISAALYKVEFRGKGLNIHQVKVWIKESTHVLAVGARMATAFH